jgi:hypothetical protein
VKRLLLVAIVVAALALTLVPLAVAGGPGGGWKHGHAKFNLVGKVVAVDATATNAAAGVLTIKVMGGSHIKGLKRTEKAFDVALTAKVWQLTEDGAVAGTLADVSAGDRVKVKGTITKAADGSRVYTITAVKYRDLTPEVAPPPAE